MNFPIKELLKGSKNKDLIEPLLKQAEEVFVSWQSLWSPFVSAPISEEIQHKFKNIIDIECYSEGGYPNAERKRICFSRVSEKVSIKQIPAPIAGLNIEGNFLFDRADKKDFRNALEILGASSCDLGDIWVIRDRGAQALCTPEISLKLDNKIGTVRDVEVKCESLTIDQLNLPFSRVAKIFHTVEASTRIDAIASAGFGLSRAKIVTRIQEGKIRLNWNQLSQASQVVVVGDQIQLEDKGSLEILDIQITKRERWRVKLLRQ